jgi:hypothetical protein
MRVLQLRAACLIPAGWVSEQWPGRRGMNTVFLILAASLGLASALYAQRRIAVYTRGASKTALTRVLLTVVGLGFGWVSARGIEPSWTYWLVFLAAFGLVHLPAAVILFIKARRGAGQS